MSVPSWALGAWGSGHRFNGLVGREDVADACPLVVFAPLVLSGDGLCGRLSRGMSENDAALNQNTVDKVMVCGAWLTVKPLRP